MKQRKKNHLEIRFNRANRSLNFAYKHKHHNQSAEDKAREVEAAWVAHEVEQFGFKFFPEHYVKDQVKTLEGMIKEIYA